MSEYIVTGRTGQNHVTSADHGAMNASFAGSGRYVADGIGDSLSAEVVTNNLVRIHSGEVFNQGRHMRVEANTYVDCTIENGSQSKLRYDLIVFRYTKNADTGVENGEIVVIKGTAGTSATDPSYTTGNILAGALQDDMPLYRVKIDGINIVGLDKLFSTVPGLAALNAKVSQLNSDLNDFKDNFITTFTDVTGEGNNYFYFPANTGYMLFAVISDNGDYSVDNIACNVRDNIYVIRLINFMEVGKIYRFYLFWVKYGINS